MSCTSCGQENDDQDQFSRSSGAALQEPVQQRGIQQWLTDRRILADIGLIASILVLVGVFSPWADRRNLTAWDAMTGLTYYWDYRLYVIWAGLAFGAALILLVGALYAIAAPKAKAPWVIVHVGGALAIIGFAAAVSDIREGGLGYGYGLFLTLVGGILGLTGILGLRDSSRAFLPKSAKQESDFSRSPDEALHEPVQERGIQRWIMDKKTLGGLALVAGTLALVGVFTPWATHHWVRHLSAWDAMTGLELSDYSPLYLVWAGLAFGAAIILLAGAVFAIAAPKAKAPWVIVHVGGALVIAAFASGLSDIRDGGVTVFSGYGYGLYLTLVGGILGLTGIWGLRGSSRIFFSKSAPQDSRLCRSSGEALEEPVQQRGIQRWLTDRRMLGRIGLMGGALAVVGVFSPWTMNPSSYHPSLSAWDAITGLTIGDNEPLSMVWAGLALHGAVFALVGALFAVAAPKVRASWFILGAGSLLAIAGFAWGLSDIMDGGVMGFYSGYGYGLFLTMVGGILGLIAFLRRGAAIRAHSQEPGIQRGVTGNRIVVGIALLAAMLTLAGIFTPWAVRRVWEDFLNVSAWNAITGQYSGGWAPLDEVWAILALHAAILLLAGAVYALVAPRARLPWGILAAGGVLTIASSLWGLFDIRSGSLLDIRGIGYGLYLTLVGGILGLIGIWKLRGLFWSHGRLEAESS
ncbi:MAG: hypothetical protein FJ012_01900 [Chloroflexi bacterium]|nr:hypothetical protein [Chloroflexota bacterium]